MHRRFFIDSKIGDRRNIVLKDKNILHQLISVFRAKVGESVILLDDSGFEFEGVVKNIDKKEVGINIVGKKIGRLPQAEISVFQSIIKKDNMELVLAKCAEIGVTRFTPVYSDHCVKTNLNFERLGKISKEASEQCGRAILPEILKIIAFEKAAETAKSEDGAANFIFHPEGFCDKLSCEFLKNFNPSASWRTGGKKFNLFIGPEGGFSDKEIKLAQDNGFYVLSLGDLTLRSETAAIVASYTCINFQ